MVLQAIRQYMPKHFVFHDNTHLEDTNLRFTDLQPTARNRLLNSLKPDGIFFNEDTCEWTIVDYTRSSGSTRLKLRAAEERKEAKYSPIVQAWQGHKSVKLFPLASSYNGAIAEDTWRTCLTRLGVEGEYQDHVLTAAVRAICIGFSSMADIRNVVLIDMRRRNSPTGHQGNNDHIP